MTSKVSVELLEALVNFRADEKTAARYEDLAGRHTEGALDANEKEELRALVRANTFISVLKSEARTALSTNKK